MLSWMKKLVGSIAAMALLGLAPMASAGSVTFSTLGVFTAGVGNTAAGNVLSTGGGSPLTLTFLGANGTVTPNLPVLGQSIGRFVLDFPSANLQFAAGATFKLTLTQSSPSVINPGSSTATTVNGSVSISRQPGDVETLDIVFNQGNPIALWNGTNYDVYTLTAIHKTFNIDTPGSVNNSLRADITEVAPLPATASMGYWMMGALGCVAGGMKLRRRFTPVA